MIRAENTIEIAKPVAEVFAWVDDVGNTPKWVGRCQELRKDGEKLVYKHKGGTMDGEQTGRTPNDRLAYHYRDKMFDVNLEFRFVPAGSGTKLTFASEIQPRSFLGKVLAPLIRRALPKQNDQDLGRLKRELERA